jgi:hypothetical protein
VFVYAYVRDGMHGQTGVKVMARGKQVTNVGPKLNMFPEKDGVEGKNGRPGHPRWRQMRRGRRTEKHQSVTPHDCL